MHFLAFLLLVLPAQAYQWEAYRRSNKVEDRRGEGPDTLINRFGSAIDKVINVNSRLKEVGSHCADFRKYAERLERLSSSLEDKKDPRPRLPDPRLLDMNGVFVGCSDAAAEQDALINAGLDETDRSLMDLRAAYGAHNQASVRLLKQLKRERDTGICGEMKKWAVEALTDFSSRYQEAVREVGNSSESLLRTQESIAYKRLNCIDLPKAGKTAPIPLNSAGEPPSRHFPPDAVPPAPEGAEDQ